MRNVLLAIAVLMSSSLWTAENKEQPPILRLEDDQSITYAQVDDAQRRCSKDKRTGEILCVKEGSFQTGGEPLWEWEESRRPPERIPPEYYHHLAQLYASRQRQKKH